MVADTDDVRASERAPAQPGPPPQAADLTTSLIMSGGVVEAVPVYCRSVLDAAGGAMRRGEYRARFVALASSMPRGRGVLLTLTADRSRYPNCEASYLDMRARLPDLMRAVFGERAVWMCVVEFQSKTGDGWPHFHLVAELRDGVTLKTVRHDVWRLWRDRWACGRMVDVQPVRSRRGAALYLCKYLTKTVKAIPPWVLTRERCPRLFGASWAAAQRLQVLRGVSASARPRGTGRRRARPVQSPLGRRLASSGCALRLRRLRIDPETGVERHEWLPRRVCACVEHLRGSPMTLPVRGGRGVYFKHAGSLETLATDVERAFADLAEDQRAWQEAELNTAWTEQQRHADWQGPPSPSGG